MEGKVPPHDIEAEQAVLGSMLTDKEAVVSSIEILRANSFYREDNKAIFQAMFDLYAKNEPIDIVTVKSELVSQGNFDRIGGIEYLASLPDKVPTSANVDKYIKIVDEKAALRELINTSNELISLGYDESENVDHIVDMAQKKVYDLSERKSQRGYSPLKDVLSANLAVLEELYNKKGNVTGISTGFEDLDRKTAGLHNSDLVIVAARPAMGKSAFAINLAANAAIKSKVPTVIFSLEMSKEQVGNRILCSESMVESERIRTGKIEDSDWTKLVQTLGELSEAPIYIDDTPGITAMEIRARARKLKMEKNIGLIVIDYLQLITGSSGRNSSREQEIAEISRSLKILAKELDIPVVALSQLSRATEKRDDKRPMMSDLRESGSIEQDADIIMFLYRDDYYNPESPEQNVTEIIIGKQRNGSVGTIKLAWLPNYTKFANLARNYKEPNSEE
jgi:replicative DNA helicase